LIKHADIVQREEKSYRFYFVHPVCVAINATLSPRTTFFPAEAPLRSMLKYLKNQDSTQTEREAYKADGIFEFDGIEICVNEISGPFNNTSRKKYQFDFHKAMYGCMAMLWNIVQKFKFASMSTLEELELYFIHSKSNILKTCSYWYI
jgi:hypothetical protein